MRVGLRHGKQRAGEVRKKKQEDERPGHRLAFDQGPLLSPPPSPMPNANPITTQETRSPPRSTFPSPSSNSSHKKSPAIHFRLETKPPPLTFLARAPVFSKPFFRGWIVVVYLWAFFAAITITCYPVWEGRASIARFFRYATGRSPVVAQSTSNPSSVIEGVFVRGHESEDVRYESEVPVKIG